MSNVEILGKPKYRLTKVRLGDQLNPFDQLKSKATALPLTYVDLVYERDATEEDQASQENIDRFAQ